MVQSSRSECNERRCITFFRDLLQQHFAASETSFGMVNRTRCKRYDGPMQLANMFRKEPLARVRSNSYAFPSSGKLSELALGGRLTSIQSLPGSGTFRGQSQHCRIIR